MRRAAVILGLRIITQSSEYGVHSTGTGTSGKGWIGIGTATGAQAPRPSAIPRAIARGFTRAIVSARAPPGNARPRRRRDARARLRLVEQLDRERPVRHRRARPQRRGQERGLRDLLAGGPRLLRVAGVHVEAVRALGGARHRQRDELAILPRDLAVVAADDRIQLHEALELRGSQLLEFPQDLQIVRIV